MSDQVDRILQQATRSELHNEFTWNYAQMGALKRGLAAKALGLDPEQFLKLPPGSSYTFITGAYGPQPAPPTAPTPAADAPQKRSPWALVGTLGAIVAAGGLGFAGSQLGNQIGKPQPAVQPAPAVQPTPVAQATVPDGVIIQEEKQSNGSWRFLWSLPAKQLPDGTAQTLDGRRWRASKNGTSWEEVR